MITYVVDNALKLIKHNMDPHLLNTNKIVKMEMRSKGLRLTLNSTFWWAMSHSLIRNQNHRTTSHKPIMFIYFILIIL